MRLASATPIHVIDTPFKFFVFLGLLFSLLVGFAAWGNTMLMLSQDNDKSYAKREALKSGIRVFLALSLLAVLIIIGMQHLPN